jgi:hypothetical protein
LEPVIGYPDEMKPGGDHDYPCPFCIKEGRSKISHLHVNYSKGKALCHGCGWKTSNLRNLLLAVLGRVPRSLIVDDGGDRDFVDHIEAVLFGGREEKEVEVQVPKLPDGFVPLVGRPSDNVGRAVHRYLVGERAVPFDRLVEVGAGYCLQGALRGYAVFPVHVGGQLVTYTSRRVPAIRLNGPKVRHGAFGRSASTALFNYDNCVGCRRLIIGEGPFDAFALHRRLNPRHGGLASLGTMLHKRHIRLIESLEPEEVVVCYDADAPDKATKAAMQLASVGLKASVMTVPKDPDELTDEALRDCYLARTLVDPELGVVESWGTEPRRPS